ncbi:hypothetical protein HYE68_002906 [Fusarium pseudograminearum]|nr:hypothetical protein HYE68_002906 [Fusarium pseudograminearum]
MSWLNRHPNLRPEDWALLDFDQQQNEVFTITINDQSEDNNKPNTKHTLTTQTNRKVVEGEADLSQWVDEIYGIEHKQNASTYQPGDNGSASTINLILASQTSSLDELPFAKTAYTWIMTRMTIHGSIVRAINRNTQCTFSSLPFNWLSGYSPIPSIVYNCRTAGSWEGDMALSVTFFPKTLTTNAVWYGLDTKEHRTYGHKLTNADIITSRLSNFDGSCLHPLILPTMFAECERERHIGLVRKYHTQLVQRINDLAYPSSSTNNSNETDLLRISTERKSRDSNFTEKLRTLVSQLSMNSKTGHSSHVENISAQEKTFHQLPCKEKKEDPEPAVVLWQNTSFLSNGLLNWQTQLRKMLEQVQDLDNTQFGISTNEYDPQFESKLARLRDVGLRIKTRIQDLIYEYDEHIRQCNHITEGLRLATQLELNDIGHKDARTNQEIARVNLKVAQMTRLDSSLMRSIATLGMIFLPATFVSTFFSMDFFQWSEEDGKNQELISSYFWVYIVVAIGLTVLTMSIFYTCVLRTPSVDVDEESTCS